MRLGVKRPEEDLILTAFGELSVSYTDVPNQHHRHLITIEIILMMTAVINWRGTDWRVIL